jgi:hypothetical protein
VRTQRVLRVATFLLGLSLASAPTALADQAGGVRDMGSGSLTGLQGNQGIRTDPATVAHVGYVHPTQIDTGSAGGDFVAIGTANGLGVSNCADDYDAGWTIYADGITGGVYWCTDYTQDAYTTGSNPSFQIQYKLCPQGSSTARWSLSFGGTVRKCQNQGTTTGKRAVTMIEVTCEAGGSCTTDRNIDVKYTNLTVAVGGSWVNFAANAEVKDPAYSVDYPNNNSVNAYLAPLN